MLHFSYQNACLLIAHNVVKHILSHEVGKEDVARLCVKQVGHQACKINWDALLGDQTLADEEVKRKA